MADKMNLDISIRGPQSIIRVLDDNVKAMSESAIATQDLFESISQLAAPGITKRATWFNIVGNNYTAIKYLAEFPGYAHVLVEATPARVPFRASLGLNDDIEHYWSKENQKKLGITAKKDKGYTFARIDTKVDIPYMIMAVTVSEADDKSYRLYDSAPLFADDPITSIHSEIYTARFPNLHYGGNFPSICWGTVVNEVHKMDISGLVQLPSMFFDAHFNTDLCNLEWYLRALPELARDADEPFKPFKVEMSDLLASSVRPNLFTVDRLISDMNARRR